MTPDIGNTQVQVLTAVPGLAPEEAETSITRPIELEMFGLPGLEQVRSITRFGVSQVTLVFSDTTDLWLARQMVNERLSQVMERIPRGFSPRLAPPSAGLGEIYTYALTLKSSTTNSAESTESRLRRLKTAQDFIVKPFLRSVKGVAEINTTGGYDREMVVAVDMKKLPEQSMDLTDVANLLQRNLSVGGGALMDESGRQQVTRSLTRVQTMEDLSNVCVRLSWQAAPVSLSQVANVGIGSNIRLGAATLNGEEAVLGTALMMAGENARSTAKAFGNALRELGPRLPADMEIKPLYDRSELVGNVIETVGENLTVAAALVIGILLIFLRNWRAALIVAAILVLSFALGLSGMAALGVIGSLLSLGAIDFGVVVDDTIVMVENVARKLAALPPGSSHSDRMRSIVDACCQVRQPMLVGMLVIMAAYLPLLGLGGEEGKMFRPLAMSVILTLASSLMLTVTLVPAFCATALGSGAKIGEPSFLSRWRAGYGSFLAFCRKGRPLILVILVAMAALAVFAGTRLGANFLPYLDEGWLVVEVQREPDISLSASLKMELETERAILREVPEVKNLYARVGMSEIATDPQGANQNDVYISFKPRSEWRKVNGQIVSKAQLASIVQEVINKNVPGQDLELNQPIAVRFDEMLEGVRTDVAIKLFGPDFDTLDKLAEQISTVVKADAEAGEVVIDQSGRNDTMQFKPDRAMMLRYMATSEQVNNAVSIGLQGKEVGRIDEGDQFYPVVVRIDDSCRKDPQVLNTLPLHAADGTLILGLGNVGHWEKIRQVSAITREQGSRREAIMVSVKNLDLSGFVNRLKKALEARVPLPYGYRVEWAGSFKNWESGSQRLVLLGGLVLVLSLLLVHATLRDWRQTVFVALGVPFAALGGIFGLWLRDLPWTMPAAIGFVTLAGLSLLNGLVLITSYNQLRENGLSPGTAALDAARSRLRPVLMTALVASVGFIPMALSVHAGAELQRPFATVVISGILTATFLTLVVVPLFLEWMEGGNSTDSGNTEL